MPRFDTPVETAVPTPWAPRTIPEPMAEAPSFTLSPIQRSPSIVGSTTFSPKGSTTFSTSGFTTCSLEASYERGGKRVEGTRAGDTDEAARKNLLEF